jgi:hypothetical protein
MRWNSGSPEPDQRKQTGARAWKKKFISNFFNSQRFFIPEDRTVFMLEPLRLYLQGVRIYLPFPKPFGATELNKPDPDKPES